MKSHYITSVELRRDTIQSSDKYPFNLPIVQHLDHMECHPNVTFLVGENGSGKSTLIEAIAVQYGFNPEGGSLNFNFATHESHSTLEQHIRLSKGIKKAKNGYFLRAESFYNVASNIDKLDKEPSFGPPIKESYGGKSLHEQSHGESFFSLFNHRLSGGGLYIFDEPESALSPQRQLAFLVRMHELVKQQSQFIIATHSPLLLAYPHAKILQITEKELEEVAYKETHHFELYKMFLENPDYMLRSLDIDFMS